jgi:ElaB/YqjD/DUF883 family membrane-anchored ribosome-binding protein
MNMQNNRNGNGTTETAATGTHQRVDAIRDSVKGLVEQGHEKVTALKDKVVDLQQQAKDRGGDAIEKASDLIKAHPFAAIGVAFAVGYIAMRLVRR